MTTAVVVSSPKPNAHLVKVEVAYVNSDGSYGDPAPHSLLDEGQSTIVHVHGFNKIVISEVERSSVSPKKIVIATPGDLLAHLCEVSK